MTDNSPEAKRLRLLQWARDTARAPDDHTIVIPAEFSRAEAMHELECEIFRMLCAERVRKFDAQPQEQAAAIPLRVGQGRTPEDARASTAKLVLIAIVAALTAIGIVSCALGAA
jgi:hypothetical protein